MQNDFFFFCDFKMLAFNVAWSFERITLRIILKGEKIVIVIK